MPKKTEKKPVSKKKTPTQKSDKKTTKFEELLEKRFDQSGFDPQTIEKKFLKEKVKKHVAKEKILLDILKENLLNLPKVTQVVRERRYTYLKNNENTIPLSSPSWPFLGKPVEFEESLLHKAARDGTLLKMMWNWNCHEKLFPKMEKYIGRKIMKKPWHQLVGDALEFISLRIFK